MDMNEEKNAADYKDFILPPASLTATQGESKAVVLTWPAVKNAVQYQVFAAESPFSTFSKVSETTSTETEITIEEEAGITKYYCISAVNYYGTVSSKSVVAMGSTLAVPIITAIDASEEGNSVSVSWWMDNCSSDTYAADVSFNVNVYALSAPNIKFQSLTVDGDTRQVEIGGLTSKTEYYFEVEVVKDDSTSKECSEKTSAETAHRVIPDAPTNVTVSQGVTTDNITITWQLPEGAWYRENSGVSGFVLHPLYFKIYRKLASQGDDKYEVIATAYVESNTSWKYRNNETDSSKPITVPVPDGTKKLTPATSDMKLAAPYETYIPGAEVFITDTTAVRGNKYTYYIQSITDDTPEGKIITADSSKSAPVDGWLISIPSFSIKPEYITSEDAKSFTKILFTYYLKFENYNKAYNYFVKRIRDPLPNTSNTTDTKWFIFSSIDELNSKTDLFEPIEDGEDNGYYTYTLYICTTGTDNVDNCPPENILITESANGKFIVTNKADSVPKIENFSVIDGYNQKFNLKWEYNDEYNYLIHYKDVQGNIIGDEIIEEIVPQYGWQNNSLVTYSHNAPVGSRRIYWLEATSLGISAFARLYTDNSNSEEKVFEALGKPEPSFKTYDYNTITVTWPKVQKSNGEFTVSAKYDGDSSELITESNCEITLPTEAEDFYKCVITNPEGYDDPTKSGKKINLTVKTKNAETNDESTSDSVNVCTVGPALVNLNISGPKTEKDIVINWNAVEGARGYLIRRITYNTSTQNPEQITNGDFIEYPDIYYYDVIENKLITKNDDVVNAEIKMNTNTGTFKLIDTYTSSADSSRYSLNQSKIVWGIPYGYLVIPVKETGNKNDFEFTMRDVSIANVATYKNTQKQLDGMERFGATNGYGLNVHAKKSESGELQELEWESPYKQTTKPSIYFRISDSPNNSWKIVDEKKIDSIGYNAASFIPDDILSAYEYLVIYGKNKGELDNEVAVSFIEDESIGLSKKDTTYSDYTTKGVPEEKANKGYLLRMGQHNTYSAKMGDGNSEIFTLDNTWDYEYRSIGPERAYVCIKNYNLSDKWNNVVILDDKLCFSGDVENDNTTVSAINNEGTEIKIEPTVLMQGTEQNSITKGPLQVLRDYKHYYAVRLERGDASVIINDDDKIFAYRNINEYELAKMVMAVFADGMNNIGKLSFDSPKECSDGDKGKIIADHVGQTSKEYTYEFNSYGPKLETPSGQHVTSLSITTDTKKCYRTLGTQGGWPVSFDTVTITVEANNILPACYKQSITFSLTSHSKGTIKVGNKTITFNDDNARRVFVPFKVTLSQNIFTENADSLYINDKNYGWWTE